jgi:hypothetical protein
VSATVETDFGAQTHLAQLTMNSVARSALSK